MNMPGLPASNNFKVMYAGGEKKAGLQAWWHTGPSGNQFAAAMTDGGMCNPTGLSCVPRVARSRWAHKVASTLWYTEYSGAARGELGNAWDSRANTMCNVATEDRKHGTDEGSALSHVRWFYR